MARKAHKAADYIVPLNINKLQGRMLHMPATKKAYGGREILILYGHHALIERWWGLIQNYADYGNVTMPDLPGFGGMDSFYKIGLTPTLDNYADYLAAFVKMRYRRRRITIVAISFGFVVATRMLQRHPDLAKKVDIMVSLVGFMHHDDFLFTPLQRKMYRAGTRLFCTRPIAWFIRYACLNGPFLRNIYKQLPAAKRRFIDVEPQEFADMLDFEVVLWQANDVRTHWRTTYDFLSLDNCDKRIDLPVWHVASKYDHYFNNNYVEQHMQVVFNGYHQILTNTKAHTPSVLADKRGLSVMLPKELKAELAKKP